MTVQRYSMRQYHDDPPEMVEDSNGDYVLYVDGWISTEDRLPPDETPVLIMLDGEVRVGELRWEHPSWEDTYEGFQYWDDPHNDGQDWGWKSVTKWMPLPT